MRPFFSILLLIFLTAPLLAQSDTGWVHISCNLNFDPNELLKDADGDGVIDMRDIEPDSKSGIPVDVKGVILDSDGDGIFDDIDSIPVPATIETTPNLRSLFYTLRWQRMSDYKMSSDICVFSMPTFERYSAAIPVNELSQLMYLVEILNRYPTVELTIFPGMDQIENASHADTLLARRADAVAEYLISKGVDQAKITIRYLEHSNYLIQTPKSENEYLMNRNVQFSLHKVQTFYSSK